jgi:hypothetical protein
MPRMPDWVRFRFLGTFDIGARPRHGFLCQIRAAPITFADCERVRVISLFVEKVPARPHAGCAEVAIAMKVH